MQVRVDGVANLAQLQREFAAVTAQVETMNAAMRRTAMIPQGGNPKGWQQNAAAMQAANRAYNAALASSGAFRVEQLKLNDAVERHTELLQRQKLGFGQVFGKKNRDLMHSIYREQLAMQRMTAKTITGGVGDGSMRTTLAIPKEVPKSWDTLNNRIGMFRYQLKSASSELVNWGKNTQWAGRQLMAGITMPVAAFGAAAGYMAYQVDKQLTRIQKVYDTTADANSKAISEQMAAEKELMVLRETAMETATSAARAYGSSVTDTLEVQAELAATGQRGAKLQASTNEIMRISMLGEIDHATTTKSLIALQATLGATTQETAAAFNYMNAIENATSLATADFAEAIPRALNPMKEMSAEGSTAIDVLQNMATLMVAMKERGIEAGEGANAIKAMMQRLYRPSKQIREEWQQLVGLDPAVIVEQAGGDIMKILPMIADAVRDLDKNARIKTLAGLFGTWQVGRMNAMLMGLDDMSNGVGQMSRVLEINSDSWKSWADIAEREQKRAAESASGRFKRALESVKAELAQMGGPFLEVGSAFLNVIGKIISFFNDLPSFIKKGAMFVAIFAALVGPVVMLTGLFANLVGNLGKMVASSLKVASSFELINKKQWATKLSAEMAAKGFATEAQAAEALTREIQGLTLAMQQMYVEQAKHVPGMVVPPSIMAQMGSQRPARVDTGVGHGPLPQMPVLMPGQFWGATQEEAMRKRMNYEKDFEKAERNRLTAAANSYKLSQQETVEKRKMSMFATTAATSTALMAVSMGTMLFSSNETADNIAKFAMIGSVVVPAIPIVVAGLTKAVFLMRAGATAATLWATKMYLVAGTSLMAAKSAGGLGAMLGKTAVKAGLIGLAIAAAGFAIYKLTKDGRDILQEQIDAQREINSMAEKWASEMGKVAGEYRKVGVAQNDLLKEGEDQFTRDFEYYRTGEGAKGREAFEEKNETEQARLALQTYVDLQVKAGATAKQAATNIAALYAAAGASYNEAGLAADKILDTYGKLQGTDWAAIIENEQGVLMDLLGDDFLTNDDATLKKVQEQGSEIGEIFSHSLASSKNITQAKNAVNGMADIVMTGWSQAFEGMQGMETESAGLKVLGIDNAEELRAEYKKMMNMGSEELAGYWERVEGRSMEAGQALRMIYSDGMGAREIEEALVSAAGEAAGLGDNLKELEDLTGNPNVKFLTMTLKQAQDELRKLRKGWMEQEAFLRRLASGEGILADQARAQLAVVEDTNDEQEHAALNAIAYANNIKMSKYPSVLAFNIMKGIKNEAAGAAANAREIGDAFTQGFNKEELGTIHRTAMEGVTSDLADMASDNFDRNMDAAIDAAQKGWDARIKGMEDAQERAMDALDRRHEHQTELFEARWERRTDRVESYWDRRIEANQKAIEAEQKAEEIRQRIFDAEQTRLERLAESANRTIDFNMALQTGQLDEAAKLRNDMEAQAQEWALSDAAAAGARGSERRINRLEERGNTLQDQRDKALEALKQREDDERKSLERRQENERKHLERIQEMRSDALRDQSQAEMDAMRKRWEFDKEALDERLELFQSYTGRNQRDLEKWMKKVGLTYDDFGVDVKRKGTSWSMHFREMLGKHIRKAGVEIANDNMWENLGARQARKTLRGMGFSSMGKFEQFIKTGKLPDDFGEIKRRKNKRNNTINGTRVVTGENQTGGGVTKHHTGGWIGSRGSRAGVARNAPVQPSERLVLARQGEYMVNADAAKENASVLEAINEGKTPPNTRGTGGGGVFPGVAGLISAMANVGLAQGVGQAFQDRYREKKRQVAAQQAAAGPFYGSLGNYNLPGVLPWVLEAANYLGGKFGISSIIGKGYRASNPTSDHPKGLALDFMTGMTGAGVAKGWALANEALKLQKVLDATYMIFRAQIHSFDSRGWQAYRHPSGATDPTSQHMDHVHISFSPNGRAGDLPQPMGQTGPRGSSGGMYRAAIPGKGWANSHDYDNNFHDPLFAIADGYVRTAQLPPSAGSGQHPNAFPRGYGSYGVVSYLTTKGGTKVTYAHLWPGTQVSGHVKAGQKIAEAASTGNSSGSHTHFEVNGSENASTWFSAHGIGLRTGGVTRQDGIANLHKEEVVVDPKRTKRLFKGMDSWFETMEDIKKKKGKRNRPKGIGAEWKEDWKVDPYTAGTGWTWLSGALQILANVANAKKEADPKKFKNLGNLGVNEVNDSGKRSLVRMGTLNTKVGTSPRATMSDLTRLMPLADVLSLTEVKSKFNALRGFLAKRGWGLHGGRSRDARGSVLAWNKAKYSASQLGTRQLGKRKADILGGRELRYANYGLLTDRKTGRSMWQVAAHTVPTPGFDKRHRRLFFEQWGNIDQLVGELRSSGAPVFLSGDLNERRDRPWFRTPEGLAGAQGLNVDWMFHDRRMAQFLNKRVVKGMHTDHAGALLGTYNIPGMSSGGHVRWDNTLANLHKKETVLTEDLSAKFKQGVDNFANGGNAQYNVNVYPSEGMNEEALAEKVVRKIRRQEERRPQSRSSNK